MKDENKLIEQALGVDFMQEAFREFGMQNSPLEAQAAFAEKLGENILKRITIEILSVLPEPDRDTFESLIGKNDMNALDAFLRMHIANPMEFIRNHASNEYEATKTQINHLLQGVE